MPWFAALASGAGSALGSAAAGLGSAAGTVGSALGSAASGLGSAAGSAASGIGSGIGSAASGLGNALGSAGGAVKGALVGGEGGGALSGGLMGPTAPSGGLFGSGGGFSMAAPGSQALKTLYMKRQGADPLTQLAPHLSNWVSNQNLGQKAMSTMFGGTGIMEGGGFGGERPQPTGQPMEEMPAMRGRVGGLIGQVTGMFG